MTEHWNSTPTHTEPDVERIFKSLIAQCPGYSLMAASITLRKNDSPITLLTYDYPTPLHQDQRTESRQASEGAA